MHAEYPNLGYLLQALYYCSVPKTAFTQANDVFRRLLKETRLAKNLTQADVAKRLGQPQSYVSKYESGERRLDFVETSEVCEAFGLTIEDFAAAFLANLAKARRTKGI